MPKTSFFVGLTVGLAGAVLFCAAATALYRIAVSRQTPAPAEVAQRPSAPASGPKAQVSNDAGDARQVDGPPANPVPKQPPPRTEAPELPRQTLRTPAGHFPVVHVPGDILDVAFDAELGRLAVAGAFGKSLGVYEADDLSREPRLIALDGPVTSVGCKRLDNHRLFVVGIDEPPRLGLVDADTLAVTNVVNLTTSVPRQLVASPDAVDPHVIYFTGPDLKGPRVFDLRQLLEVDSLGPGIVDAAFSPDGQTLFFRSSSRRRGVGLFSQKRTITSEGTGRFGFERIGNKLGSSLPMYPGPNGWLVASGKELLSNDLQKTFSTVGFEPQAFFSKKPWMAGMRQERFCIGSINDCRTIARVDVPAEWLGCRPDAKPIGHRPRELRWQPAVVAHVLADERNDQFLLAALRHLVSFPLSRFHLPAEETLWITTVFPETVTIGRQWSIQLKYPGQPSSVSLSTYPPGMALNGMTLEWTPQETDFGDHEIQIVAKSGGVERSETRRLHVGRPYVESPFPVSGGIDVSEDSRRVVVWGQKVAGTATAVEFQQLGVIDLASRRVVSTRELPMPFSAATLIGDDVYVLRRGQLERLSPETLEQRSEEAATLDRAQTLTVCGKGHRPWRFDLKSLKRLDDCDLDVHSSEGWLAGPTGFGWISDGVLWNEATGKPKLLLWPYAFRRTSWQHTLRSSPHSAGEITLTSNTWHPCSHNPTLSRAYSLRNRILFTTVSADLPATLAITQDDNAYHLAALSLIGKREIQKVPLVRKPEEPFRDDGLTAIETKDETYVVLFQGKLYTGSLLKLQQAVEEPLHVVPQQSVVLLQPDRPTTVRYESNRAKRFHLESRDLPREGEWFHAESTTGEFTISVTEVLDKLVEAHVELVANLPNVREATNEERLDNYLKPANRAFSRLLGREPEGVPIPVRVFVTAEGDDLEKASIAHDFLVEVPLAEFVVALEKEYPSAPDRREEPKEDKPDPAPDRRRTLVKVRQPVRWSGCAVQRSVVPAGESPACPSQDSVRVAL